MSSELILIYVLKSTFITAIMYGYYRLALKDNKFHYYNRFYLLGSLGLSLIIPLLNFHWFTFEKPAGKTTSEEILLMIANPEVKSPLNTLIYSDWIFIFITMIGISLLTLLVISILKIYRIKRNSPVRHFEGIEFIETDVENAPFSFLNNLFWKKGIQINDENGQKIFKHEVTHIRQKHSWDRLFCQIVGSILWINPFNWIIQKELETIHEFIADEEAVGENNTEAFAKLLLETHYGTHFLNPIHALNYSSIKRRLAMLTKSNKTEYSYLRRVMALPIMLMALAIFSIKVNAVNNIETLEIKIEQALLKNQGDTIKEKSTDDKKMVILEKMNSEKGKEQEKIVIMDGKATISDLKPEDIESIRLIRKEGLQLERDAKNSRGEVIKEIRIVGSEFSVEEDRNNDLMIVTTKSKNDAGKKIIMVVPSNRSDNKKLLIVDQNGKAEIENAVNRIKGIKTIDNSANDIREIRADTIIVERKTSWNKVKINDQVIYILDGKKVDSSTFKNIKPDDIESVTVLKGESAQKKYSDLKGSDVIEIILKKK